MNRTTWKMSGLAFVLALIVTGGVWAQQHQEHHPEGTSASAEQPAASSPEAPATGQMMGQMQGMMENMQGMMSHMQTMMEMMGRGGMGGRGAMTGTMGRRGMTADEADEDDEGAPWSGMMGRRGMMGRAGMGMRHLERLAQQLDLTDEQEARVRSLLLTHMKDAIRARADIDVKKLDLRELLQADTVDLAKVKALLQAIASQKVDLHLARITLGQEINKLLNPEQQQKFRSMRLHMMRGGRDMMGRGGMQGQGGMMGRGGMKNPCGMTGRGAGKP